MNIRGYVVAIGLLSSLTIGFTPSFAQAPSSDYSGSISNTTYNESGWVKFHLNADGPSLSGSVEIGGGLAGSGTVQGAVINGSCMLVSSSGINFTGSCDDTGFSGNYFAGQQGGTFQTKATGAPLLLSPAVEASTEADEDEAGLYTLEPAPVVPVTRDEPIHPIRRCTPAELSTAECGGPLVFERVHQDKTLGEKVTLKKHFEQCRLPQAESCMKSFEVTRTRGDGTTDILDENAFEIGAEAESLAWLGRPITDKVGRGEPITITVPLFYRQVGTWNPFPTIAELALKNDLKNATWKPMIIFPNYEDAQKVANYVAPACRDEACTEQSFYMFDVNGHLRNTYSLFGMCASSQANRTLKYCDQDLGCIKAESYASCHSDLPARMSELGEAIGAMHKARQSTPNISAYDLQCVTNCVNMDPDPVYEMCERRCSQYQ